MALNNFKTVWYHYTLKGYGVYSRAHVFLQQTASDRLKTWWKFCSIVSIFHALCSFSTNVHFYTDFFLKLLMSTVHSFISHFINCCCSASILSACCQMHTVAVLILSVHPSLGLTVVVSKFLTPEFTVHPKWGIWTVNRQTVSSSNLNQYAAITWKWCEVWHKLVLFANT